MRLLLLFLALAILLGCRDAIRRQRGDPRPVSSWPLLAFALFISFGYLTQRLLE